MRAGFTLLEGLVALAVLAVVLVVSFVTFSLGKKDRATWESRVDDVYAVISGLERLRREIETARFVAAPVQSFAEAEHREFLVTVDAAGRPVVYSVQAGALVAETMGGTGAPRVLIPRTDRIVFSFRADCAAVRFQVWHGGLSLVGTVAAQNDLLPASFAFGDTYGL
jgi:prepilin-type N-terminal cleavage/methylation domain-containing protein